MYAFIHGMNVALHRDCDLLASKRLFDGRRAGGLRFVPFPVFRGNRVNVVRRLVAVDDFEVLADLQPTTWG